MYQEKEQPMDMEKNNIIRYGILALEALERLLTKEEKRELQEIRDSLRLSHKEIIERAKTEIMS